jgi:hypothetical protein
VQERRRDAVLVVGFAGVSGGVATRLISLGYRPISVSDPSAGALRIAREQEPVRVVLVPANAPFLASGALRELARGAGDSPRRCLALGACPDAATRERLRAAGVHFTLEEPCSDRELRFALNRALYDASRGQGRSHPRVATDLVARVRLRAREKVGLVYALSVAGCFLETDRPCMPGSLVALHLPLPGAGIEAAARVTFANVPGDFARSKLPCGMALEFLDLGTAQRAVIARYVEERLAAQALAHETGEAPAAALGLARLWARVRRLGRAVSGGRTASARVA